MPDALLQLPPAAAHTFAWQNPQKHAWGSGDWCMRALEAMRFVCADALPLAVPEPVLHLDTVRESKLRFARVMAQYKLHVLLVGLPLLLALPLSLPTESFRELIEKDALVQFEVQWAALTLGPPGDSFF